MALETTKSNKALKLVALQTLVEMEVLDTVWEMWGPLYGAHEFWRWSFTY